MLAAGSGGAFLVYQHHHYWQGRDPDARPRQQLVGSVLPPASLPAHAGTRASALRSLSHRISMTLLPCACSPTDLARPYLLLFTSFDLPASVHTPPSSLAPTESHAGRTKIPRVCALPTGSSPWLYPPPLPAAHHLPVISIARPRRSSWTPRRCAVAV